MKFLSEIGVSFGINFGTRLLSRSILRAAIIHPDRTIGIAAFLFTILFPFLSSFSIVFLIAISVTGSLFLTLPSLRLTPRKYAKAIVSSDSDVQLAMPGLIREAKAVLYYILVTKKIIRYSGRISVISELKILLADKFKIDTHVFCTVILGFSPDLVVSRIEKLQENDLELKNIGQKYQKIDGTMDSMRYTRTQRISLQSNQITQYCQSAISHLDSLLEMPIDWKDFQLLSNAPSSSSALIRYIFLFSSICERSSSVVELEKNIKMLHRMQHALPGTSPHSLLFGATKLIRMIDPSIDKNVTKKLLALLELPLEPENRSFPATDSDIWKMKEKLDASEWAHQVSDTIMKLRESLYSQFTSELNSGREYRDQKIFIIVDSYSRAVRTLLKHCAIEISNVELVFLSYGVEKRDFGLRQMAHEVLSEPPKQQNIAEWQKKCRGRIHFVDIENIDQLDNGKNDGPAPRYLFLVGTGGIKYSLRSDRAFYIKRGRSIQDLEMAREKLSKLDEDKVKLYAVAAAYKHRSVLAQFWDQSDPPDLVESTKQSFEWKVDRVFTNDVSEYLATEYPQQILEGFPDD